MIDRTSRSACAQDWGKPTLLIFAKAPRIGAGKQRLARAIGKVNAWRINRRLHALTLRAARDPRWETILYVADRSGAGLQLPGVWPQSIARMVQTRGDLGAKLAGALQRRRNVAVIGTDCPSISRAQIAAAFAALRRAPFVLGPSADGGFWLFAARDGDAGAAAMANVRWSTEHARADVEANIAGFAHSPQVVRLPMLADIDTLDDLIDWGQAQREATRIARASSGV